MRLGSLIVVMTAWLAATACVAVAQDAPDNDAAPSAVIKAKSNAATLYRRAFAKHDEIKARISEQDWTDLSDFAADFSRGPSQEVRQTLSKLQPIITLTKQAGRRAQCDFDVDYADADGNYDQMGEVRSLLHVVGYDYLAQIAAGDTRVVMEELATMYRVARHVRQERVLMGSFVASAIVAFGDTHMDMAFDHALIGPMEATALLRELEPFQGDDPLQFQSALAGEDQLITDMMAKRFAGDEGLERFRTEYREWFPNDPAAEAALSELTPERLQTMLTAFSRAAGRTAEAMAHPDPEQTEIDIALIGRDLDRQGFAPLASFFLALNGERVRDFMQRSKKQLDDRRALLTDIAEGRINPMALANGAVWYIRATAQLEQIDPDKRRAIDAYLNQYDQPAGAELTAIFNRHDVQTLVETLQLAASLDRCDFSYAAGNWPYTFNRHHAGLLGCGRILVADAARLLHEQRYDDATLRLGVAFRMSADVASDGFIAGSLTAHRIFSDADRLVAAAIDSRMLDTDQIALLAANLKSLSRGDPFHYHAAVASMRRGLDYPMTHFVQGLPKDLPDATQEQRDRAEEILATLEGDRILSLMSVYQQWETLYYKRKGDLNVMCEGLEAIFDVQAMRELHNLAPLLTDWAHTGQMEQVLSVDLPMIAPIEQSARDSLADYRRCVLRLDRLLSDERSISGRGGG